VVSVLATAPKGCGFEPGQDDGFFKGDKNPLGSEIKREGPMS
jgi:hypothetical protein